MLAENKNNESRYTNGGELRMSFSISSVRLVENTSYKSRHPLLARSLTVAVLLLFWHF
jgi:hypothetical protein